MRVLLIRPPREFNSYKIYSESLALGYIASVLRADEIETDILDAFIEDLSVEKVVEKILTGRYSLIGLTIPDPTYLLPAIDIVKKVKKEAPNIHITMGGYTPTFDYKKIFSIVPELDSISRFEGEIIMLNLAKAIEKKNNWQEINGLVYFNGKNLVVNPPMLLIENLDKLPFPSRDYLNYLKKSIPEKTIVYIQRGRGCYGKCTYCGVPKFYPDTKGKRLRFRTNDNLVSELEEIAIKYNFREFFFVDDVFIGPAKAHKKMALDLANKISNRRLNIIFSISERVDNLDKEVICRLKESGLVQVFIGAESASQRVLNRIKKGIKIKQIEDTIVMLSEAGLDIEVSFINFLPDNTLEDIEKNVNFFSKFGLDILRSLINRLKPYPGTEIYKILKKNDNLIDEFPYYKYNRNTVDERVDRLYNIVSLGLSTYNIVSYKLKELKRLLRKKLLESKLNPNIYRINNETRNIIYNLQCKITKEASSIFREALIFVKNHNSSLNDVNFARELYNFVYKQSKVWLERILFLLEILKKTGIQYEICQNC